MQPYLVTVSLVLGLLIAVAAAILAVEVKALRDDTPGNHITAAFRTLLRDHGPLFYLISIILSFCVGTIFGHIFCQW